MELLHTEQKLALELDIFCLEYSVTWMLAGFYSVRLNVYCKIKQKHLLTLE